MEKIISAITSIWNLIDRLVGGKGSVYCNSTISTKVYSIKVVDDCVINSITGGGPYAQTFIGASLPMGTLITFPTGNPATAISLTSGSFIAYK